MQSVSISARQARRHYRHELRTLTYITLDQANGGIVRNLNDEGLAVQAVAALRQDQRVRLRFELRFPRLRVETYGQVTWTSPSGRCGIRFIDLPEPTAHQIQEWIFANLLESAGLSATHSGSIFGESLHSIGSDENLKQANVQPGNSSQRNGALNRSPSAGPAVPFNPDFRLIPQPRQVREMRLANSASERSHQNWLSRPLSARTFAWLVDALVITAALLLFALIFLSIAHELPRWPLSLAAGSVTTLFIVATYRMMFAVFGGPSAGARLAQASSMGSQNEEEIEAENRFN